MFTQGGEFKELPAMPPLIKYVSLCKQQYIMKIFLTKCFNFFFLIKICLTCVLVSNRILSIKIGYIYYESFSLSHLKCLSFSRKTFNMWNFRNVFSFLKIDMIDLPTNNFGENEINRNYVIIVFSQFFL